jgi:hypothetical protein
MAAYEAEISDQDLRALEFAEGRYGWASIIDHVEEEDDGTVWIRMRESDAWRWRDEVDEDMEGGHDAFPLLDTQSELANTLYDLYQGIV